MHLVEFDLSDPKDAQINNRHDCGTLYTHADARVRVCATMEYQKTRLKTKKEKKLKQLFREVCRDLTNF